MNEQILPGTHPTPIAALVKAMVIAGVLMAPAGAALAQALSSEELLKRIEQIQADSQRQIDILRRQVDDLKSTKAPFVSTAPDASKVSPSLGLGKAIVTISGVVGAAVGRISESGATPIAATGLGPRAGLNTSETLLSDDGPTRIDFDVRTGLFNGMVGIAKVQFRPTINGNSAVNAGGSGPGLGTTSGTMYVGVESSEWGTLRLGAMDQHTFLGIDAGPAYGPLATTSGLLNYTYITGATAGAATPITPGMRNGNVQQGEAGVQRVRNLVRWDSPSLSGFRLGLGYSFHSSTGMQSDLTTSSAMRKGRLFNINPSYKADIWRVVLSYVDDKRDATASTAGTVANDWKGWRLLGDVKLGSFTIGALVDTMRVNGNLLAGVPAAGTSTVTRFAQSDRQSWQITGKYEFGNNLVTTMYSRAANDKVLGADTGAKDYSITYAHLFPAGRSIGIGYAVLKNDRRGGYTFPPEYTGLVACQPTCQNGYNSGNAESFIGEKQTYYGVTFKQAF